MLDIDKIKIGWKEYEINKIENSATLIDGGTECYGEVEFDKKHININSKYSQEQQEATLIHEVLHALEDMYRIDLGETTVLILANALYATLKDNNLKIVKE